MHTHRLPRRLGVVVAAGALALTTACGSNGGKTELGSEDCREQWNDVAQSVYEMDSEQFPSALSERWSTIIAGAEYQRDFGDGKDCAKQVSATIRSIDTLRLFSNRLRAFDMEYQLNIVAPQSELYLTDDLPKPRKGKKPPTKRAVRQAYRLLQERAEDANQQLTPAWQQALSIDLADADQVRKAIKDLDRLAVSSPAFRDCQRALDVIVKAIKAQEAG